MAESESAKQARIEQYVEKEMPKKNWHQKHLDDRTTGEKIADGVASFVGSWKFVIIQTCIMAAWVIYNTYVVANFLIFHSFDPFPFVFLNLFMSAEAAYSTPFIMMSQNRAAARDRVQAEHDYQVNENSLREIKSNTELTQAVHQLTIEIREKLNKK